MARRKKKIVNIVSSSDEQDYSDSFSEDCGCGENESTNISELVKVVEVNGETEIKTEGESKVKGFHGSLYDRIRGLEFYQPTIGFFYKIKEETPRLTDPNLVDMQTSWSKVFEKFKLDYETLQDRNIRVHYSGNWSASPKVVGVWIESDYIGGRNFLLENVSAEYIFFDNFLPSFLQSLPNPYGYTINIVDDPIFLTRGVIVPLANDRDCLMMMREADIDDTGYVNVFITFEAIVKVDEQPGVFCTPPIKREKKSNVVKKRKRTINYEKNDLSEEELDPIPDLVEDVVLTVVVEEFNELKPYNVNIDHIDPEEVYRSEEFESERSEGYEPVYEDFIEQTQELVDETEGELVPTQMEVEEPYVGMEWSTLKSCRTYLRSYAIANRFVYKGLKNDGDRIRVKCRGTECTWLFYARVIKSKKSDGFTIRCNKYEGQHSGKCRGDSKFKSMLADAIWVADKMLDTVRTHHKAYKAQMIKEDVWNKFGVKISYYIHGLILADLEKHDKNAVDWLKKRDVTTWCRSHFWSHTKSEHVTNNWSESFNNWIMDLRDKPVCTFVEELDLMLMTFMRKRRAKAMELNINDVVPRVKAIHAKQEKYIQHYIYRSATDTQFTMFSSLGSRCYCSEYLTVKAYSRSVLPIPNDIDWGQGLSKKEQEEAKVTTVASEGPESSTAPRKKSQPRKTSQVEGGLNSTSPVEEVQSEVQVEPPATI
ncbi:hypothetical protein IFM89_011049 [Coptis chinensis]|uniref:Transposase MuDR plant domain-containing protein n=1 Tax=Coptis chinensis TaxID=261450 RepID=A0A835IN30_9MAGN|nr:hypothetical protein IFM89_011049 [Coptis chinensis]